MFTVYTLSGVNNLQNDVVFYRGRSVIQGKKCVLGLYCHLRWHNSYRSHLEQLSESKKLKEKLIKTNYRTFEEEEENIENKKVLRP